MSTTLQWSQVHAWHLGQHGLAPRFPAGAIVQAVRRTCGIQAQVMSAAELAICTRVQGLRPQEVASALWCERTLVKTWTMRSGTLHLLAARDLALYVAARRFLDETHAWANYFAYYGLTPAQQEAFLSAVPQVLGREPLTRQQLAEALVRQTGIAQLRDLILASSWGTPLKPSAFRGDLCFGPTRGQMVTFVNPRAWPDEWQSFEPEQAMREIVRRYLRAYGPATPEDFARWWWGGKGKVSARRLFRDLAEELAEVEVEGWQAFALRATLGSMLGCEAAYTAEQVRLLPLFDAYTIGMPRDREPLLALAHKAQVFRPQGWISAVVLVNGSVQGVWHATSRRSQTIVRVHLFRSPPTSAVRTGIESEVERLRDFFARDVLLEMA
ncbi:MAG TPA: winged helix DNA-binding domain-containing protein [Ktedonobacteraceae bacterium]|jgi:hypothetical protein